MTFRERVQKYAAELARVAEQASELANETKSEDGIFLAKVRCRATVLRSVAHDLDRFAENYKDTDEPDEWGNVPTAATENTGGDV